MMDKDKDSILLSKSWKTLDSIFCPLISSSQPLSQRHDFNDKLDQTKQCLAALSKSAHLLGTFETYLLQSFTANLDSNIVPKFLNDLESSGYHYAHRGKLKGRVSKVKRSTDDLADLNHFLDTVISFEKSLELALSTCEFLDTVSENRLKLHRKAMETVESFLVYHIVTFLKSFKFHKIFVDFFNATSKIRDVNFRSDVSMASPRLSMDNGKTNSSNMDGVPSRFQLKTKFTTAFSFISSCNIFSPIFEEPLRTAMEHIIHNAVQCLCTTDFPQARKEFLSVEDYTNLTCMCFIRDILDLTVQTDGFEGGRATEYAQKREQWKSFLSEVVLRDVALFRIEQIFAMIVEYPDSQPAIDNLNALMGTSQDMSNHLVSSVKSAFETRLLHPGANTSEILTQYINAIKVLRQFDLTCSILDRTCAPLVKYLRSREDTVRCIVCNMTEDAELAGELLRRCELQLASDPYESDDDNIDWRFWKPKPRDFPLSNYHPQSVMSILSARNGYGVDCPIVHSHRYQDTMSILVNIYESKELFVNEYRSLLADRILNSASDFDSNKELRHLELLSYKFGNDEINKCNVMLRDVAESKRTNEQLQKRWSQLKDGSDNDSTTGGAPMDQDCSTGSNSKIKKPSFPINTTIISAQFWPTLKEDAFELPPKLKEAFESYKSSYEGVKQTRTVLWLHQLGKVDIELETDDGAVRSFTVTPPQAAVLHILETKKKIALEDLSRSLGLSTSVLRRKLGGLFSLGILIERNGVIEVAESNEASTSGAPGLMTSSKAGTSTSVSVSLYGHDEDDSESAMVNVRELKEEEMKCYWMYTVSMLRNLKSMSAENIHSMLKMFSKAGNSFTELTQEDLTAFLNKKVKEELLCYSNGIYRLPDTTK